MYSILGAPVEASILTTQPVPSRNNNNMRQNQMNSDSNNSTENLSNSLRSFSESSCSSSRSSTSSNVDVASIITDEIQKLFCVKILKKGKKYKEF